MAMARDRPTRRSPRPAGPAGGGGRERERSMRLQRSCPPAPARRLAVTACVHTRPRALRRPLEAPNVPSHRACGDKACAARARCEACADARCIVRPTAVPARRRRARAARPPLGHCRPAARSRKMGGAGQKRAHTPEPGRTGARSSACTRARTLAARACVRKDGHTDARMHWHSHARPSPSLHRR